MVVKVTKTCYNARVVFRLTGDMKLFSTTRNNEEKLRQGTFCLSFRNGVLTARCVREGAVSLRELVEVHSMHHFKTQLDKQ